MERRETDRSYLHNLHEKYYGKKKRREQRQAEKKKQLFLFETFNRSELKE